MRKVSSLLHVIRILSDSSNLRMSKVSSLFHVIRILSVLRLPFLDRVDAAFNEIQNGRRHHEENAAHCAVVRPAYVIVFPVWQPIPRVSIHSKDDQCNTACAG
uniref:Uncharacterized protein n=1 Tax=Cacopsylla melanoneura TaxID=428564 RepID=A0A8D8YLG9_9HEMI